MKTIAIDGTKSRAHNSRKANFSQKKIDRQLDYIDEKVADYMQVLAQCDDRDDAIKVTNVLGKIEKLKERKIDYEFLEKRLQESAKLKSALPMPEHYWFRVWL